MSCRHGRCPREENHIPDFHHTPFAPAPRRYRRPAADMAADPAHALLWLNATDRISVLFPQAEQLNAWRPTGGIAKHGPHLQQLQWDNAPTIRPLMQVHGHACFPLTFRDQFWERLGPDSGESKNVSSTSSPALRAGPSQS